RDYTADSPGQVEASQEEDDQQGGKGPRRTRVGGPGPSGVCGWCGDRGYDLLTGAVGGALHAASAGLNDHHDDSAAASDDYDRGSATSGHGQDREGAGPQAGEEAPEGS